MAARGVPRDEEAVSRYFVDPSNQLNQIMTRGKYVPGSPCPACHVPLELAWSLRWCSCLMCYSCARGVVWSCPLCGAHPLLGEDVDMSAAHPKTDMDLSAVRWLCMFSLGLIALFIFGVWMGWT